MSELLPDAILRHIETLKRSCAKDEKTIIAKELLICDMIDNLAENKSLDLKDCKFLDLNEATQFETSCHSLPPTTDPLLPCPLKVDDRFIRTVGSETLVTWKLNNCSKNILCNVVGSIYCSSRRNLPQRIRSCLVEFAQEGECPIIANEGNDDDDNEVPLHVLQSFNARYVKPKQFVYLTIAFDTLGSRENLTVIMSCLTNSATQSLHAVSDSKKAFPHKSAREDGGDWRNWQGTLCELEVDPWSSDSDLFLPPFSDFCLSVSSLTAFTVNCTAKISLMSNFTNNDILSFEKLTEDLFVSRSPILQSLVLVFHRRISNDFYYTCFASTENVIERFFKKLIQLKYCTKIQVCDINRFSNLFDIKASAARKQLSSLNDFRFNFVEAESDKIRWSVDGRILRKLKIDLSMWDLKNFNRQD